MATNNPSVSKVIEPTYLGDAVYASFDGFSIWLGLNDDSSRIIALEPGVLQALVEYVRQIDKTFNVKHFNV